VTLSSTHTPISCITYDLHDSMIRDCMKRELLWNKTNYIHRNSVTHISLRARHSHRPPTMPHHIDRHMRLTIDVHPHTLRDLLPYLL